MDEICRKMGVSEPTFYRWKKQFGGMGLPEIRRLKQLEEENGKLKRLVADLTPDRSMLQSGLYYWRKPMGATTAKTYIHAIRVAIEHKVVIETVAATSGSSQQYSPERI